MAKAKITTKDAIAEIKKLGREFGKLQTIVRNTTKVNKASFAKMKQSIASVKKMTIATNNKLITLQGTVKKQASQINKLASATNKATTAQKKQNIQIKKSSKGFLGLGKSVSKLLAAFGLIAGAQIFARLIKNTFKLIVTFDSLNFTINQISKDMFHLGQSHIFLNQLVQKFGVRLVDTANRWIKFSAAAKNSGLSLKATQDIFRSMTKASAVLGLKTDELRGIYLALEQMLSKGKITTEELRRQLGERLPGAMGIMAASMGVTIEELDKMMKKGQVLSSEVLPRFAEAVETAFGINSIEKVDNLQAAMGRLTGQWQLFVDKVINSDSQVSNVIKGWFGHASRFLRLATIQLADPKSLLEFFIADQQDMIRISADAAALIQVEKDTGISLHDLRKDTADKSFAISDAETKAEKELAEKAHSEAFTKELDFQDKITKVRRDKAQETLDIWEEKTDRLKEFLFPEGKINIFAEDDDLMLTFENYEGNFKNLVDALGRWTAMVNDAKLALEKGAKRKSFLDEDNIPKVQKQLKEKFDLTNQIQIKILEGTIANNKAIIASDKTTFDKKGELEMKNLALHNRIAELKFDDDKERAEIAANNEKELWQRAFESGTASKEKLNKALIAIDEEFIQKEILAELTKNQTIINNAKKAGDSMLKFKKDSNQFELDLIQSSFDKEKAIAVKLFNLSKKGKADEIKLTKTLANITFRALNAKIDAQIIFIKLLLEEEDLSKEIIAKWMAFIAKLEASRPKAPSDIIGMTVEDWEDFIEELLGLFNNFSQAIGDIIQNIHDKKIENINAEIDAESRKFDKLIELAEKDEQQQQTLRRNKKIAIEKLEKERLKEEQKAAKARKIFAISDIAISAAQAIMNIQSKWAWNPIIADILSGILIATAVAQTAAVLAAPIPQFAEGGKVKKTEKGMINDAGVQEYVERDGKILTTKRKNAIVALKQGDTVYKDYSDLAKKSIILSSMLGGQQISENEFNLLFSGITNSIKDGFKEAKITNKINLRNNVPNNSYKEKMSRWN